MSQTGERELVLKRLDAIERSLKSLLFAFESKHAPAGSIEKAMAELEVLPFDAEATVRAFQGASQAETQLVNKRLTYLADLDAIVRTECQRLLATTTVAIERAQVLKARLDTLGTANDTGDSVDCVR
jgi:hypothetical protein